MLSLLAMAALILAAFLDWLGRGIQPPRIPLRDLVQGISYTGSGGTGKAANFWSSLAVPLLAAAVLALGACLLASRTLAWLSFAVAFVSTGVWTALITVYRSDHGQSFASKDWHVGYWSVLVGLTLGLIAAAIPWRRPGTTAS